MQERPAKRRHHGIEKYRLTWRRALNQQHVEAGQCPDNDYASYECDRPSKDAQRDSNCGLHNGLLTVKLRGRTEAPDQRRGCTISSSARGAKQTTHHGPLQRLLGCAASTVIALLCTTGCVRRARTISG